MTNASGSDSVPTVPVSTVGLLDVAAALEDGAPALEDVAAAAEDVAAGADEVSAAADPEPSAAESSEPSEPQPAARVSDARTHAVASLLMSTSLIRGRSRDAKLAARCMKRQAPSASAEGRAFRRKRARGGGHRPVAVHRMRPHRQQRDVVLGAVGEQRSEQP